MDVRHRFIFLFAASALFGLTACSSGGGSSSGSETSTGSRSVYGVISGFGSVFVNGVEYETDRALIRIEGANASERDLQVGMVVGLQGRLNTDGVTGVAEVIEFADELEGVVLENSVATDGTGPMNIMGQTVRVSRDTVFESDVDGVNLPSEVIPGNVVEVSGHGDGRGQIFASRLEVKRGSWQAGDTIELKGIVQDLDSSGSTFRIGDLLIDFSAAQEVPGELANGLYVEVESDSAPEDNGSGYQLTATRVERAHRYVVTGEPGGEVEIAGIVTDISSLPDSFELNGQTIRIQSGSSSEDEIEWDAIRLDARVEVEGVYGPDGRLVAREVESEDDADTEFVGFVEAIDSGAGTIIVSSQVIQITSRTRMIDSRANAEHYFDLSDLAVGDFVEVAVDTGSGTPVAMLLEREDGN